MREERKAYITRARSIESLNRAGVLHSSCGEVPSWHRQERSLSMYILFFQNCILLKTIDFF